MAKSYIFAVEWVAFNDNFEQAPSLDALLNQVTVKLVADLYGKPVKKVAQDVLSLKLEYLNSYDEPVRARAKK